MRNIETDICVIGAGSGGLSVAAGAVQMGARVVLIEADEMGGDCLNYGCVPSKALLHAGADNTIAAIEPHDSQERFEKLGCTVIRAHARFTSPREVLAGDHTIRARRFVIATGSSAVIPPIEGLADVPYLTNETLWSQKAAPEHLIVMGGGPIGVEMALAHCRLGAKVSLVEGASLLSRDDPEAAALVRETLEREGVAIYEGAFAQSVSKSGDKITVELANGKTVSGTDLLVAVGRRANVEGLDLTLAGVNHDAKGIDTNKSLRTSNRRIYALGDVVAGNPQFTHVAGYQAGVLIRSLLFGMPAKSDLTAAPYVTYAAPELAQIGLTEKAAQDHYGKRLSVARAEYSGNDRALATARAGAGFIKLMVVKSRVVGVTIVGPDAGEHITFWSLVMANRLKLSQVAGTIAPYPTLSELNKRAVGAYFTPALFENPRVKQIVRLVQKFMP